jgi:hypothetical protein
MRWTRTLSITKDPDAVVDYKFDWSAWLAEGESIVTRSVTASTGLTVDSSSITDTGTSVTVWLSGGSAGSDYTVACKIVTSAARTDERTMTIQCRDR